MMPMTATTTSITNSTNSVSFSSQPATVIARVMTAFLDIIAPAHSLFEAEQVATAIDHFAGFRDGWDGDGSIAPSTRIISAAKACAKTVFSSAPFADVAVLPHGTIAFDWDTEHGSANLEIGKDKFSFYLSAGEKFYPLAGDTDLIPINEICAFVALVLDREKIPQQTRATSYISAVPFRYSYV